MPATATGRGAQVIIDPASDTAKAVRGAYASTLEANAAKVAADIAAGVVSSGYRPDGTTSTGGPAADPDINPSTTPDIFAGGISLGSTIAGSPGDLSKHLSVYAGTEGINYSGNLNYTINSGGSHAFYLGATLLMFFNGSGLNMNTGRISFAATPTIGSGAGAATGTQPSGSIWMRSDGTAGNRIYVSQGGGTWIAIATV